jgi:hypothetical protein
MDTIPFQNNANPAGNRNPVMDRNEARTMTPCPQGMMEHPAGGSLKISSFERLLQFSSDNFDSVPHFGQSATPSLMLIASAAMVSSHSGQRCAAPLLPKND